MLPFVQVWLLENLKFFICYTYFYWTAMIYRDTNREWGKICDHSESHFQISPGLMSPH